MHAPADGWQRKTAVPSTIQCSNPQSSPTIALFATESQRGGPGCLAGTASPPRISATDKHWNSASSHTILW